MELEESKSAFDRISQIATQVCGEQFGSDLSDREILDKIAQETGAIEWESGGGVLVLVIGVDKNHAIGVTTDSVILYESDQQMDDPIDIVWEGEALPEFTTYIQVKNINLIQLQ